MIAGSFVWLYRRWIPHFSCTFTFLFHISPTYTFSTQYKPFLLCLLKAILQKLQTITTIKLNSIVNNYPPTVILFHHLHSKRIHRILYPALFSIHQNADISSGSSADDLLHTIDHFLPFHFFSIIQYFCIHLTLIAP